MSQQNVDQLREAFEHFLRGGDPQLERLDPDFEIHDHDVPDADVYRGRDGYLKWVADWGEAWDDFKMEPERWIDAGDKVVLILSLTAKGRGSGVEVTRRDGMVWTLRDGKPVRIDYYNNERDALEAAGLET